MKRIAMIQEYNSYTPEPQDFVKYNAQILMNSMFSMYTIKNGEVEMLHFYQIEEIAKHKSKTTTGISDVLQAYIEKIPENLWQDIINGLNINPPIIK